jgi:predicted DNA-binding transcriptional regulator AlpA
MLAKRGSDTYLTWLAVMVPPEMSVDGSFLKGMSMRLLRYKDLGPEKGIWYSRTHIRRISNPASKWYQGFPTAVAPSPGRRGYPEAEIDAWLGSRPRLIPTTCASEEEQDLLEPPMGLVPTK